MSTTRNINVLLVEDDENLGFVTSDNLESRGFSVTWSKDGEDALRKFEKKTFDVCVFDVMLPLKDGFTLATEIRTFDKQTPILFLTAKAQGQDKIKGFTLGGDDYVTKPFNIDELSLRIKALFQRAQPHSFNQQREFNLGATTFDFDQQTISCEEKCEKIGNKEAEILRLLCLQNGEVLYREVALKTIWGENDYFKGRSMDVFVAKLRKALKIDPSIEIKTIHGKGFQLVEKN